MEKGIDAVFYNFRYYILPEYCAELSMIEDGAEIKAKRLKEELCMAPNFIYESVEEEMLTVENAKLLFPVKVNLYSREEYDGILRGQVNRVCPGCIRYTDDGTPELNGHHREISLEGVCYEREEEDDAVPYARRVFWFFEELTQRLDELAKCIDNGDDKKLDKICKQCAEWIVEPEKFVGGVKDGKYCIYMKAGYSDNYYRELFAYTAKVGSYKHNGFAEAGWLISPYIEAGALRYRGKIKDNTPVATVAETENKLELHIYCKESDQKKKSAALDTLYDYLTDKLGEAAFIKCVESVYFTSEKEGLVTASELAEKIAEKYESEDNDVYPPTEYSGWEDLDGALPHRRTNEGVTSCAAMTVISYNPKYAEDINFGGVLSYAYVFAPATQDNYQDVISVLGEYLIGEEKVPEPLIVTTDFAHSFSLCGTFVCADDECKVNGVALDCFVADEKAFFRFMKILTPVLTRLNARIVVVNEGGVTEYKAGYIIEPVDGEAAN